MDNSSLAHTKWNCKYHIVFAPKFRRQIIYRKIKADIGVILRKLCDHKGVEIADEEHIVNVYDVAKILSSYKGMRKNITCSYRIVINKADTIEELEKAKAVSKELWEFGINETVITTLKD